MTPHDDDPNDTPPEGADVRVDPHVEWHAVCPNCGEHVIGHYCHNCGQRADTRLMSIGHLLRDTLEDQLSVNSALPRTMRALFLHPGLLSTEYSAGRIVRYIAPFRLYLIASIVFFLVVALQTDYSQIVAEIDRETSAVSRADSAQQARSAAGDTAAADTAVADTAVANAAAADTAVADTAVADTAVADTSRDGLRVRAGTSERMGNRGVTIGEMEGVNLNFGIDDTINVPWWRKPIAKRLKRQEERINALRPAEALQLFLAGVERNAPTAAFLMLPLFAFILKLLYVFRKRYYVEHFVFSLHVHSFAFLLFTAALLIDSEWFTTGALIWLGVYILLAMRRVYRQRWLMTVVKFVFLFFSYSFLLSLVVAFLMLFTAVTI